MSCEEGFLHRTSAQACPYRPRDYPRLSGRPPEIEAHDECSKDSDCTGAQGHCEVAFDYQHNVPYLACHDGCRADADCAADELCRCHEVAGDCQRAYCRTDAECEPGQQCIGTDPLPDCQGEIFACSQIEDECIENGDCTNLDKPICEITRVGTSRPSRHCAERLYCE